MTWILVIVIGGWATISDVKTIPMTEQQCKAAVREMAKTTGLGVGCFGPDGQKITGADVLNDGKASD